MFLCSQIVCEIPKNNALNNLLVSECCPSPSSPTPHLCAVVQMCDLLDANRRMQEELMEKDQAIKVLQQKMADLKKTLQKELVRSRHLVVFLGCGQVLLLPYNKQLVFLRCRNHSPLAQLTGKPPIIPPIAVSAYPLPQVISNKKPTSATSTSSMWS